MKKYIAVLAICTLSVLLSNQTASSQGCVAVRPMGCSASGQANSVGMMAKGEWQISSSYRYFRSFRHFRGSHEEAERVENGTEVINIAHSTDLSVAHGLTDRFALSLNLPLIYYDRSSLYEHYGNSITANPAQSRFHTGSMGIGDMRLTANFVVFNPQTAVKGNMSVGVGIKTPTGRSDVQDTFHKLSVNGTDSLITKAVDQSIQLGDGAWGINLETQGFRSLFKNTALYFNAFYLLNPRKENNVGYSAADQYAARLGFNYVVLPKSGLSAGLGGRIEGIPSEDLLGNSEGRRRPGYIISIEPSVSYLHGPMNFTLDLPIALYRNRTQSVSDKQRTRETGVFRNGDAAFADYLINFNVSYSFGGHPQMAGPTKISIPGSLHKDNK